MSKTEVRLDIDGAAAAITFFTDEGLNILSSDVLHSLGAVAARAKQHPELRTLVVRAEGKVFLAGADIKQMINFSAEEARDYGQMGQDVLGDLASLPCVTVAAINGATLGGGMELALACDFRIAVKSAKLGLPEVTLGLIPGWGGVVRTTRLIGPSRAKKLYLTGAPISAVEALTLGLVDETVNSVEDLGARVSAFCRSFGRAAPAAIALAKRASRDMDEVGAFADCFHKPESREGMEAFLKKRPASWMQE